MFLPSEEALVTIFGSPGGRGISLFERLAKSDAGNAGWQRDLSVSYNKIGDVLVAQGALGEALKSYRDSHAIFERRLMPLRPVRSTSCMRRV